MADFTTVITPPPPIVTTLVNGQGPAGVGLNPAVLTASEDLPAGSFVNVFAGGVRLASNDHSSKPCHGWVAQHVVSGAPATVNFTGQITQFTGLTLGPVYLGASGGFTSTPPGPSRVVQQVGIATTPSILNFQPSIPVVLSGTPV